MVNIMVPSSCWPRVRGICTRLRYFTGFLENQFRAVPRREKLKGSKSTTTIGGGGFMFCNAKDVACLARIILNVCDLKKLYFKEPLENEILKLDLYFVKT